MLCPTQVVKTIRFLENRSDDDSVTWKEFLDWVSEEALTKVHQLEKDADERQKEEVARARAAFSAWGSNLSSYVSYAIPWRNRKTENLDSSKWRISQECMYPGVFIALGYGQDGEESVAQIKEEGGVERLQRKAVGTTISEMAEGVVPSPEAKRRKLTIVEVAQLDSLLEEGVITEEDADKLRLMLTQGDDVEKSLALSTLEKLLQAAEKEIFI